MNKDWSEIIEKTIKVFLLRVLGYAFGFFFIWIIATELGPKTQGIFSMSFMFLLIGTMISKFGLETSLVKWVASSQTIKEASESYFDSLKISVFISIIIGIILFLLSGLISRMYEMPELEKSIKLAAICIPLLTSLEIASNYFRGEKKVFFFGLYFHLSRFLFSVLFLLLLFHLNFNNSFIPMLSFGLGILIIVIISQLHILLYFKKNKVKYNSYLPKSKVKSMLSDSYPMMISSSIVLFMGWSDVFVLGFFVDEESIGVYSTSVKIATVLSFVYNAVLTIVTPKIADFYYSKKDKELSNTMYFSSMLIFITGLPIFLVLYIFSDFFLSFFGELYLSGSVVLKILLLGQLANLFTGAVGPFFQMTGRQKKLQQFIIYALLLNITLSLILVNFYLMEGVAIASAFAMAFWNIAGAIYLYKKLGVKVWVHFKQNKIY